MTDQILRKPDIERITGMTERHIRNLEARGEFPRRVKLGARAVGWRARQVEEWIASRVEAA